MTKSEIVKRVKEAIRENRYDGCHPEDVDYAKLFDVEEKEVKYKKIQEVGGEGEGEHYHVVFNLTIKDVTVMIYADAYYTSYDGTDFSNSNVFECEPYQKTVTDYRKVTA